MSSTKTRRKITASSLDVGEQPESGFPAFLTAYDPSDLPGISVDPLGFERGYLFLADKILPGLTNVANRPRYFSLLCAGSYLAPVDFTAPPRTQYSQRLSSVLRLERLWALANVLARRRSVDGQFDTDGIRGILYVEPHVDKLIAGGARSADADFKMLSRQVPYGAVGIYGAITGEMRLWDRKTLSLSPDLGERLAEGFIEATALPRSLRKAVTEDGSVSLRILEEWGQRAHVSVEPGAIERRCLREVIVQNDVRGRMARLLAEQPPRPKETELQRLSRIGRSIRDNAGNADLREAIAAVSAYEDAYRTVVLAMKRLLWLCRTLPGGFITSDQIRHDPVLALVAKQLPKRTADFCQALDDAETENFRKELARLEDVRKFLKVTAAAQDDLVQLCQHVLSRHTEVQRGKFDRGRRKMPWLEESNGRVSLTVTRVGGSRSEVKSPTQVPAHPYRLSSADALIRAANFPSEIA